MTNIENVVFPGTSSVHVTIVALLANGLSSYRDASFNYCWPYKGSKTILQPRPFSVCISACNDDELAGEDVSDYGGWGGKLICQFLDRLHSNHRIEVMGFYRRIRQLFAMQSTQAFHPVISYNV